MRSMFFGHLIDNDLRPLLLSFPMLPHRILLQVLLSQMLQFAHLSPEVPNTFAFALRFPIARLIDYLIRYERRRLYGRQYRLVPTPHKQSLANYNPCHSHHILLVYNRPLTLIPPIFCRWLDPIFLRDPISQYVAYSL